MGGMARRLRIEYPGAMHHVINRGNYRRDLFESVGAAEAFLRTLFEGATKFGWRVHAYVLMRNHFHLAVETPEPTLGEGMHWLQSSMATRFNRLRAESGHLFQGRYQALLIEDGAALARVVDYIHLNPVRAKIVLPEQATNYRWSSLAALLKGPRPALLTAQDWLQARGGWSDVGQSSGPPSLCQLSPGARAGRVCLVPGRPDRSGARLGNRLARVATGAGERACRPFAHLRSAARRSNGAAAGELAGQSGRQP